MRKMINIVLSGCLLLSGLVFSGCGGGGASGIGGAGAAPPVDIPTPVTGRITISSPDADGNISVIGEEGAVSASATVMVVNEDLETASFYRLSDWLVRPAYADAELDISDLETCAATGHECGAADEDGAFEITIYGEEGHVIAVVIIDGDTGEELSERLKLEVPVNIFRFTQPVSDVMVDTATDGDLYVLLKGSIRDGVQIDNRMVRFTPSDKSKDIDEISGGMNAVKMDVNNSHVAVVDITADGLTGYFGLFPDLGTFSEASIFDKASLEYRDYLQGSVIQPVGDLNLSDPHMYAINQRLGHLCTKLVFEQGEWISLEVHVPLLSGGLGDDETYLADTHYLGSKAVAHTTIADSRYLDGVDVPDDPILMGTLAFIVDKRVTNSDGEASVEQRIALINEEDLLAFAGSLWSVPYIISEVALPSGADAVDLEFLDAGGATARLMITDKGNDAIYVYTISGSTVISEPGANDELPDISFYSEFTFDSSVSITDDRLTNPLEILHVGNNAFVTADNGDDTRRDSVFRIDLTTNEVKGMLPVGLSPTGLSYDVSRDYLYVSSFLSQTVTRWSLSELAASE